MLGEHATSEDGKFEKKPPLPEPIFESRAVYIESNCFVCIFLPCFDFFSWEKFNRHRPWSLLSSGLEWTCSGDDRRFVALCHGGRFQKELSTRLCTFFGPPTLSICSRAVGLKAKLVNLFKQEGVFNLFLFK